MTPDTTILPATPADLPTVLRFIRELAEYEKLAHLVTSTQADLERALFGARPVAEAVIARLDGTAVGFALFFHNFSTFSGKAGIYLEDLYVTPEVRGRGVGKAVLRHLAKLAVERDCCKVQWSVLNWNAPSIAFYKSLGATPDDEWTVYRLAGEAMQQLARTG